MTDPVDRTLSKRGTEPGRPRPGATTGRVGPPIAAGSARPGPRTARLYRRRHRGIIFIIALATTVVLTAMLLVYAQEMRTESSASANRSAAASAAGVASGAEQWVLANVENFTTPLSGNTITTNVGLGQQDLQLVPAAGVVVGDPRHGGGYFWVLNPDPAQDQGQRYGIADENAKLNLNTATADQIQLLPGVTPEAADAIVDWIDVDENVTNADGAESSYYAAAVKNEPYAAKNGYLDTVDELLLVKGVTPGMMWGMDLNRDGVVDAVEATRAAGAAQQTNANGANDRRGFANYVTCYTTRANPSGQTTTPVRPGQVPQRVVGLVNLNTAPAAVLMCLPGLSQTDAQTLIDQRAQQQITGASSTLTWAQQALGNKYAAIQPYVTAQSYQFSADIVAVSGDGRAFRRVRLVVDTRTQPAKVLYHKDVTDLGWPLPADVRAALRAGKPLPDDATPPNNGWSTGVTAGAGAGAGTGMTGS